MPPTALAARAVHGPAVGWTDAHELAAATVDRLGDVVYLLQAVAGVKDPERPPQVPRPGPQAPAAASADPEPVRMSTKAEIAAFFGSSVKYTKD